MAPMFRLAVATVLIVAGCGGRHTTAAPDSGGDGDADGDSDGDTIPTGECGNGTLEPGEECDDRNRLNGDGCDWLCRRGDGEPPPPLDRSVSDYELDGSGRSIPGVAARFPWPGEGLPVTWTGHEVATAFAEAPTDEAVVRFMRMTTTGEPVGTDWVSAPLGLYGGLRDVVWAGDRFGLAYQASTTGLSMVLLNREGAQLGDAVVIEPDPRIRPMGLAVTDDGFVLAWAREESDLPGYGWCSGGSTADTVYVRRVSRDLSTSGHPGPVLVEDHGGGPVAIATGRDGFGIAAYVEGFAGIPDCATRFIWVSADLTEVVYSGILSSGSGGDVVYLDGRYYVAWPHWDDFIEDFDGELCVARFTERGVLEAAPVCNPSDPGGPGFSPAFLAAGDGGLGIVAANSGADTLFFSRTDLNGTALGAPRPISGYGSHGGYGITWADDAFAVLFTGGFHRERPLYLQLIRRAD